MIRVDRLFSVEEMATAIVTSIDSEDLRSLKFKEYLAKQYDWKYLSQLGRLLKIPTSASSKKEFVDRLVIRIVNRRGYAILRGL